MKKRNFLVSLLLVVTMLLTACGNTDPLEGKWKGTCDLSDYFKSIIVTSTPDYEPYANFENLSFVINFEFDGENMSMSVDEASAKKFTENVETCTRDMLESYIQSYVAEYDGLLTADDVAVANGYESYDAFIDAIIEAMGISTVADTLCESLDLHGTYEYDEETGVLAIVYEGGSMEEMTCKFEGDTLIITISDGVDAFDIKCEKQ